MIGVDGALHAYYRFHCLLPLTIVVPTHPPPAAEPFGPPCLRPRKSLMSLSYRPIAVRSFTPRRSLLQLFGSMAIGLGVFACRGADKMVVPPTVELRSIAVDSSSRVLERGTRDTMTATAQDRGGKVVSVPVVWRSSNEKIAVFERG